MRSHKDEGPDHPDGPDEVSDDYDDSGVHEANSHGNDNISSKLAVAVPEG